MKEVIKVIYVLNSSTMFGGANKSFLAMLTLLRQHGVEPLVVTPDTDGIYRHLTDMGVRTLPLNYRTATYPPVRGLVNLIMWLPRLCGRLWLNHQAALRLAHVCRDWGADLVHTNVSVVNIGFKAARRAGIPHLWHIREYGDLDFGFRYIWSRGQQIARYHLPNSYTVCITKDIQRYNNLLGHNASKVIYNGIISKIIEPPAHRENKYFLFVGRLEPAKGIAELLGAYDDYRQQVSTPLPLYIAGDTDNQSYKSFLLSLAEQSGLCPYLNFMGMCEDVSTLYAKALAVIVPSHNEGFGRVVAEAMSMGCPVIGHDTAGISEQLENGRTMTGGEIGLGYTTKEQLVNMLLNLSGGKNEDLEKITTRALKTVRQLYTTESNADGIFQFYQSILEG